MYAVKNAKHSQAPPPHVVTLLLVFPANVEDMALAGIELHLPTVRQSIQPSNGLMQALFLLYTLKHSLKCCIICKLKQAGHRVVDSLVNVVYEDQKEGGPQHRSLWHS